MKDDQAPMVYDSVGLGWGRESALLARSQGTLELPLLAWGPQCENHCSTANLPYDHGPRVDLGKLTRKMRIGRALARLLRR